MKAVTWEISRSHCRSARSSKAEIGIVPLILATTSRLPPIKTSPVGVLGNRAAAQVRGSVDRFAGLSALCTWNFHRKIT